jgi:hypothetical protein
MKLTVTSGGVPPGSYTARLTAVERVQNEQYGPGLKLVFTVTAGKYSGQRSARTTGSEPTPRNSLGRMLSGMLGRPLTPNEEVDIDDLIGREYLIVVAATDTGATRVETAVLPPSE